LAQGGSGFQKELQKATSSGRCHRIILRRQERHITGDVILDFMIDRNGGVKDLIAVSGDPILTRAAVEAVQQWKYKRYLLNGEPVEVETTAKITFRMKQR
jgi:TonB family protein